MKDMSANTKAFILKSLPYGESDRIVTLFTPSLGKLSAYAKGCPFLQPLSLLEVNLSPGKKELYRLKDPKLLDPYLSLRDQFGALKAALKLADSIDRFLPPEVPKPHLFDLLLAYLSKLPSAKNPESFYYSFMLKTLHVEGILDVDQLPEAILPLITSRRWEEIDVVVNEGDLSLESFF